MTGRQWAALALGAVAVFWMVGAYNRLVALRNVIFQAWAKVDEALGQRTAAIEPLLAALHEPLATEQGALDTLQAAQADAVRAATTLRTRPVHERHASAWVASEAALAAAASRVFALLEQHAELALQAPVAGATAGWREATARLVFARQLFNDAADHYNGAIAVFPTRALTRLFGFGRAGRI
ncbi:MAG: LemA family protein [Rubrivivax sp.]|nr:LemA family protein [Rubrivivax sp.]